MGNRAAKFISTLFASIIAGVPLAAVSQNAPSAPPAATNTANATSDCLASPKGVAPQGQHWYYRLERGTKRQCWYLRAEGGKVTQTAQAAPDTTAAESAASPHPVQDARAEYLAPQSAAATKPTTQAAPAPMQQAAPPAADNGAQQPAVETRWPDASASPAPQAAPVAAVPQPSAKPSKSPVQASAQASAQATAPVALAAADGSIDKPTGSLQTLVLVIGGALALAGLLASLVYRFAGGRVRVQATDHRRVNWDHVEPHDLDDGRAPWLNTPPAEAPRAQQPRPVDFDAARPQILRPQAPQIAAFTDEIGRIAALSRPARNEVAELDEADIFNGAFEIEAAAPKLATSDAHDEEPVDETPIDRNQDVQVEDAVDVDVITAMLERLAQQGPRLRQPSPEADLADFAQTPRGQSAARA